MASIGRHWHATGGGINVPVPKTAAAAHGMAIAMRTVELIDKFQPTYFFIENPRGMLRKMLFMQGFKRHTVTYCQYGDFRQKPTDIWTNCDEWVPRPPCKPGASCHVAAPRGSRTGTQGMGDKIVKAVIPHELCVEIMTACHVGLSE